MAGHDSEAPASTRLSPTKIPPSAVTEVGVPVALPGAGGGWQQPEADFLKCKSGPRWQRRAAAGMGTPERSMPSDALTVVRTSHWRHTAFGMPKQTSIAAEQSRCGCEDATTAQPVRHKSADKRNLLSSIQSGSTRHGRAGGPIQTAPGSA